MTPALVGRDATGLRLTTPASSATSMRDLHGDYGRRPTALDADPRCDSTYCSRRPGGDDRGRRLSVTRTCAASGAPSAAPTALSDSDDEHALTTIGRHTLADATHSIDDLLTVMVERNLNR